MEEERLQYATLDDTISYTGALMDSILRDANSLSSLALPIWVWVCSH